MSPLPSPLLLCPQRWKPHRESTTHLPALLSGQHSTSSAVPTYSVSVSLRVHIFIFLFFLTFFYVLFFSSVTLFMLVPSISFFSSFLLPLIFFYCCFRAHITHLLCWGFLYGMLCLFAFDFTEGFASLLSSIGLSSHVDRQMFMLI